MMIEKHNASKLMIALWSVVVLFGLSFWLSPTQPKDDSTLNTAKSQPASSRPNQSTSGTELQGNTTSGTSLQGSNVDLEIDGGSARILQGVQ